MVDVTVEPHSCICPSQNYTCQADLVVGMEWQSDVLSEEIDYNKLSSSKNVEISRDGVRVYFTDITAGGNAFNITSYLFITDIQRVNESRFLCEAYTPAIGSRDNTSVTICVIGKMILDVALKFNYRVLRVCTHCCACLIRSAHNTG